jgi:glucose uptake protein GlcU
MGSPVAEPLSVLIQLLGATYFAFALTNWTAKDNMIGGIYSRPLSLGNCVHFVVGALALAKQQFSQGVSVPLIATLVVYAIFAICFAWLVFGHGAACRVAAPAQPSSRR